MTARTDHHHCCPLNCVRGSVLSAAWDSWEKAGKKSAVSGFVTTMASKSALEICSRLWGPCHCFGRDNSAEALSWTILFKAGPPANANAAQGWMSFFTVVGWVGVPATLHAQSDSFSFYKTSLPFRKINLQWKIILVVWNSESAT